ncbi:hypothetical protein CEP52_005921 [Fusarium oligoseptatum]|uniref:Uncharacterized protein n=1 Tax=Fusarium oligoseptatum TaxID=2604345 RepID=A0A428TVI6_9HYPO|nr:hypothetical protein CEP52_005921 [Fusarium oligoseptatum]
MAQAYRRAQGGPEPAGTNTGVSAHDSDGKAKFNLDDQKGPRPQKALNRIDREEGSNSNPSTSSTHPRHQAQRTTSYSFNAASQGCIY